MKLTVITRGSVLQNSIWRLMANVLLFLWAAYGLVRLLEVTHYGLWDLALLGPVWTCLTVARCLGAACCCWVLIRQASDQLRTVTNVSPFFSGKALVSTHLTFQSLQWFGVHTWIDLCLAAVREGLCLNSMPTFCFRVLECNVFLIYIITVLSDPPVGFKLEGPQCTFDRQACKFQSFATWIQVHRCYFECIHPLSVYLHERFLLVSVVEIHGISHSALLLHNHESRPHHVTYHMILSVIFDDTIHIMKALLITDKSSICYWLAY